MCRASPSFYCDARAYEDVQQFYVQNICSSLSREFDTFLTFTKLGTPTIGMQKLITYRMTINAERLTINESIGFNLATEKLE